MKSPPRQIHDDIAFNRVEAFIRGEDNETLVGTEKAPAPKRRRLGAHDRFQPIRRPGPTPGQRPRRPRPPSPERGLFELTDKVSGVNYAPHRREQAGTG